MLSALTIKNFAIIEDLRIEFGSGLSVLTGETGAGKSIIIEAVNLLLGSRASADLVRTGEKSAELEAFFDLDEFLHCFFNRWPFVCLYQQYPLQELYEFLIVF